MPWAARIYQQGVIAVDVALVTMDSLRFGLSLCLSAVLLLIIPVCWTQQIETDPEILVETSLRALAYSIEYYRGEESRGAVHKDELLGLRVATDSLLWTVDECLERPDIFVPSNIQDKMKLLCAKLNVLLSRILNIHKPRNLTRTFRAFLDEKTSLFDNFRSINIDKEDRRAVEEVSSEAMPEMSVVQTCIGELSVKNKSCHVPGACWKALQPKFLPGPLLTHQAMLLLQLTQSDCKEEVNDKWSKSGMTIDDLADGICFTLYPRVSSFHYSEFLPDEEAKMFLDSFFACSLLGFEDYLHVAHMRISSILENQLGSGCFGFMRMATERSNTQTEECIPRMTSSGVAALALYVRWLIHSKGYVQVYGKQPFKAVSWGIPIKLGLMLLISGLVFLFFRRIQRALRSFLGRVLWIRS